jgi:putative tryptophan/tyrosine transport system substrate-binding protein
MGKKTLGVLLVGLTLALVHLAEAQQAKKVPQIGFLTTSAGATANPFFGVFRQGLRELGYIEGKNINIEYRYADGRFERLPELAEELVRLKVDILVAANATVAREARKLTATIPVVMANFGDPIGSGLVASLARPGGNVTGLYNYFAELVGKRLELLKEVLPKVSRFAFLTSATDSESSRAMFKEAQVDAKALGLTFQLVEVKAPNPDFDGAFRVMAKERIGALVTGPGPLITFHRKRILELVEQNRIPAIHPEQRWANSGGLMSYGANQVDLYRHAAVYVDKILKGAKPGDLPVEQPKKFELIINLKAAKQIGLTIPPNVLARADKVIK